jgi:hypothetical protein
MQRADTGLQIQDTAENRFAPPNDLQKFAGPRPEILQITLPPTAV